MSNLQLVEYQTQRVLTTQQLAEVYQTVVNNIQMNFANNKDRFIEGVHYYFLQGETLKTFKVSLPNEIGLPLKYASHLYLWTEKGASRHCKILDTDQAWKQFDILEETYFKVKIGGIQPMSQLEILLQVTQALVEQDKAIKQLAHQQEEQDGQIKELTAKVKTIPDEYYSIAGYANLRGFKVDISKAGLLGRKATKLSKEYDIDVGKVYDPRFGQVNTYHLDVLSEVFDGFVL